MESIFFLEAEPRGRLLGRLTRTHGFLYICLWSYIPEPSNCLISLDGWFHEEDGGGGSSAVISLSPGRRLFDAYRRCCFIVEANCVPGLAFKEGRQHLELGEPELMSSASQQLQRQFYQEAGIKTVAFMGCKSGEVEMGMQHSPSNISNMKLMDARSFFEEDLIQYSLRDHHSWHSSSSSLHSLSAGGSPESSTFLPPPPPPLDQYLTSGGSVLVDVMASALQAVPPEQYGGGSYGQKLGAFEPYQLSAAPPPLMPMLSIRKGQKMIKMAISLSRNLDALRRRESMAAGGLSPEQRPAATATNQLHHMISERKRREKLNDSFHALRSLLPPGIKKDKASVLAITKDYLGTLKAQVSELEEKNRDLWLQLNLVSGGSSDSDVIGDGDIVAGGSSSGSTEAAVTVKVCSSSSSPGGGRRVAASVAARETSAAELALHILDCLGKMRGVGLLSFQACNSRVSARVELALHVQEGVWEEEFFKKAVATAAAEAMAATPLTAGENRHSNSI